ncbi:RNA-dependent RNA polymerase [Wenzhou tapeworm virus 1]|uniref:Replicase n=1 Tax=Wenzhou tapeworm virus 1 TaxID=1923661 RepID=A0A1L3KN08_9MONO|nr:RNA-dependent RNA polymerase [Wenzhou tapeworm virus 1]APG78764.1 RNA-dependent RNA polymerase [Wenzhou tapeworm virus 1]
MESDFLSEIPASLPESSQWVRTFRGDRNLSTALSESFQLFVLNHFDSPHIPTRIRQIIEEAGGPGCYTHVGDRRREAWICLSASISRAAQPLTPPQATRWVRDVSLATKITMINMSRYCEAPSVDPNDLITVSGVKTLLPSRFLYDSILMKVSRSTIEEQTFRTKAFTIIFLGEQVFFHCLLCQEPHFGNYTDFLCASDVNLGRIDVLLYAAHRDLLMGTSITREVISTLSSMDHLLTVLGRDAYAVLKCLPSLATAVVLAKFDPLDNGLFLNALLSDLLDEYPAIAEDKGFAYLTRTPETDLQAKEILELSGLWKMAGHPVVSFDDGLEAVLEKGFFHKAGLSEINARVMTTFRCIFSYHYFKKHGRWPNADVSEAEPYIRRAYYHGYWPEREGHHTRLRVRSFTNVHLKSCLAFDHHPDLSELISDTSINPGLSHWHYESCPDWMHKALYGRWPVHRIPRMRKNRPILVYMKEPDITLDAVLQVIEEQRVPEEWKVITLVAKERELKEKARFFAKNTYEIRLWQVATEKAIAQILEYLPYQSMTMGNDALQHRLIRMSRGLTGEKLKAAVMILDFSGWNLRFRHNTIGALLREIDHIYGFENVFSYTHLHPMRSTVFIKDPGYPIEEDPLTGHPLPGPRCYRGQESYFEGLRQKGWTLYTLCLILSMSHAYNYRIEVLGQGDNQAIIIHIPENKQSLPMAQAYVAEFKSKLANICAQAQIPIKPEETWCSSILFEYGRTSYYKGGQVPSALKKASRLETEPNNTLSSLFSIMSNCYSGGISIAGLDTQPASAYFLSTYAVLQVLRRNVPEWYELEDSKHLMAKLLVPAEIGGISSSLYDSFCVRGCADPLTRALAFIKWLWDKEPSLRLYITPYIRLARASFVDRFLLLQDPTCLALQKPQTSENQIRTILKPTIRDYTTNPQVSALFSIEGGEASARLRNDLSTLRPYNARVASLLYSFSNAALADRFVGRFTSPLSVVHTATREVSTLPALWDIIRQADNAFISFFTRPVAKWADLSVSLMTRESCTFEVAEYLRRLHWGEVVGVTMPSPFEQVELLPWDDALQQGKQPIMAVSINKCQDLLSYMGPYMPYLGHDTAEKISKNPLDMGQTTSVTRAAIRITSLIPWICADDDSNLRSLFKIFLAEKGVDISEALDKIQPLYVRGSLYHRLADPYVSHGCRVNSTPVLGSHVLINTDLFGQVMPQGNDQTFFFQEVKAWILSIVRHMCVSKAFIESDYAVCLRCPTCTRLIDEPALVLPNFPTYPGLLVPVDDGLIQPKVRDIASIPPDFDDYQTAYSWALASLGAANFVESSIVERQSSNLLDQAVNLNNLRKADPVIYMRALLARLMKYRVNFQNLSRLLYPWIGRDSEIGKGRIPLWVSNMSAAGLLEKIFIAHGYRGSLPGWTANSRVMTQTFISMLGGMIMQQTAADWSGPAYFFKGEPLWVKDVLIELYGTSPTELPYAVDVINMYRNIVDEPTQVCQTHSPPFCDPKYLTPFLTPLQDPQYLDIKSLHYMTRSLGLESTSMTKIAEVLTGRLLEDPGTILSLAEGDGGILSFLGHVYPDACLLYNSLQPEIKDQHMGLKCVPSLYADVCNIGVRVTNFFEMLYGVSDISNPVMYDKLDYIMKDKPRPWIVTCDVNVVPHYRELHQLLSTWVCRVKPEQILIKWMANQGDYPSEWLIKDFSVEVIFPWSSNPITGECYLVGHPGEGREFYTTALHRETLYMRTYNVDRWDQRLYQIGYSLYQRGVPRCFNWPESFIRSLGGSNVEVMAQRSMIPFLENVRKDHIRWLETGELRHSSRITNNLVPEGARTEGGVKRILMAGLDCLLLLDVYLLVARHFPRSFREIWDGLSSDTADRSIHLHVQTLTQKRHLCYRSHPEGFQRRDILHMFKWSKVLENQGRRLARIYTYEGFLRNCDTPNPYQYPLSIPRLRKSLINVRTHRASIAISEEMEMD